jgi:5-methyltetrahydropteroyltriglutamate--homocysteine methyltransferase
MRSLAEVGCTYLQIDETSLVKLGDARVQALLKDRGEDWRDLLKIYIDAVNAVVAAAPAGMTVGVHICRSQDPTWQADVGYDPIAEPLFNDMKVGIYFLEYDNARSGSFEPLSAVPPGKFVVLGLVASKVPELETADLLKRRIEEASRYVRLEQLALSPQCGFASDVTGNRVTEDDQKRKLELVVRTARMVWR